MQGRGKVLKTTDSFLKGDGEAVNGDGDTSVDDGKALKSE